MKIAFLSNSIVRVGIAVALFVGSMAGTHALLNHFNPRHTQTGPSSSSSDETKTATAPKPSEVKWDDLTKLNAAQRAIFCKAFPTKTTAPIDPSDYQKMGITKEQYLNFTLYCQMAIQSDEFLVKDKSGENDARYRRDAQKYKDLAAASTFDLYDTSYKANDIQMTARGIGTAPNDAPSLEIVYSTVVDGGYSPYFSKEAVRIQVFDMREFTVYKSNCGPMILWRKSSLTNQSCQEVGQTFLGSPIYRDSDATTVTVGNTRIKVKARNDAEALTVLRSMKKVTADQIDFFVKA